MKKSLRAENWDILTVCIPLQTGLQERLQKEHTSLYGKNRVMEAGNLFLIQIHRASESSEKTQYL